MNIKPGIKLVKETEGKGLSARQGDKVTVLLNGWLNKGTCIQENHLEAIVIGRRSVIPGIEYSLEGMKVGGIREVKISPHLGYKHTGVENLIPANALLNYKIEVLKIE